VDGVDLPVGGDTVRGAPYQRLRIQAASGEVTSAGVRTPFTTWDDGVASPDRDFEVGAADTAFVARYSGQEFQVGVTLEGGRFGVDPGAIASEPVSPGLWFEGGSAVTLTAEAATGFAFEAWTGALEGAPNPVGLVVDAPVEAGATFSFVFQVPDPERFTVTAGDPLSVLLSANNASEPVQWELIDGRLPVGVVFRASGGLAGEAIELGSFAFTVRARDAAGLEGTATVSMDVAVPELPLAALASDWLLGDVGPTAAQVLYLDYSGNRNGALDLGDVRAHLVRAAAGPTVPPAPATVERVLVVRVGEGR
jgi:hypothetical protein